MFHFEYRVYFAIWNNKLAKFLPLALNILTIVSPIYIYPPTWSSRGDKVMYLFKYYFIVQEHQNIVHNVGLRIFYRAIATIDHLLSLRNPVVVQWRGLWGCILIIGMGWE